MALETPYAKRTVEGVQQDSRKKRLATRLRELRAEEDGHRRLAGEHLARLATHRRDARNHHAEIEKLEAVVESRR